MSLNQLLTQPLSVQTMGAPTKDAYGDEIPGGLGTPFVVLGFLEQKASVEFQADRDTTVSDWVAHMRVTRLSGATWIPTLIGHLDQITFQGQLFQVNGVPEHAYNPRLQAVSHLICKLVAISG
ncbi:MULTISPECIES: hypothetical protein [unclassified Cryobacterium]|uniref:hypothetical protein n=1 Tax=unclassified Cryobacterium TaxID=2649013 RepID=UPI00106B495C|nr:MULTISPECIES: hypothetical protein [unclassified Cryobacterium]TFB96528.1 hypothetical protein E3O39_10675 [Cryobacterium sp. MDB2-A-1]TFC12813.1 hypothetical protein E3O35_07840 [Cryobacterium sp. MDB2-A-2]